MGHTPKTLAIRFRRGMIRETRYFHTLPSIHDVLDAFDTSESDMGVDSLGWLESQILPQIAVQYGIADNMPCSWRVQNGDWTVYTLCE